MSVRCCVTEGYFDLKAFWNMQDFFGFFFSLMSINLCGLLNRSFFAQIVFLLLEVRCKKQ